MAGEEGAGADVPGDDEPADWSEAAVEGIDEAEAAESAAEPEEEPPPHDAQMSAPIITIADVVTDLIAAPPPSSFPPGAKSRPCYNSAQCVPRAWTVQEGRGF